MGRIPHPRFQLGAGKIPDQLLSRGPQYDCICRTRRTAPGTDRPRPGGGLRRGRGSGPISDGLQQSALKQERGNVSKK